MSPNSRTGRRRRFNSAWLADNLSDEVHYVYCLVNRKNRFVGYFGVTNDPKSRAWQHKRDATRTDSRRSKWLKHNDEPPELVVLGAFPNRDVAEIIERCLISRFNHAAGSLSNDYKYFNRRQERDQLVLDDIPFFLVPSDMEVVG